MLSLLLWAFSFFLWSSSPLSPFCCNWSKQYGFLSSYFSSLPKKLPRFTTCLPWVVSFFFSLKLLLMKLSLRFFPGPFRNYFINETKNPKEKTNNFSSNIWHPTRTSLRYLVHALLLLKSGFSLSCNEDRCHAGQGVQEGFLWAHGSSPAWELSFEGPGEGRVEANEEAVAAKLK